MKNTNRIIVAFLVVQIIGGIVLCGFLYNFVTNPNSALNKSIAQQIQNVANSFSPLPGLKGEKGDTGEQGIQGSQGVPGVNGQNGADGIQGTQGVQGQMGATGAQGDQGIQGSTGEKGDTGQPGATPQFQCNQQTAQLQYKYPEDESWTNIGSSCVPNGGNDEQ